MPLAVYWHEGMMLHPQHFQQLDSRLEQLSMLCFKLVQPFYWGIIKLDIDESALQVGTLRINTLEAILPDGLYFSYDYASSGYKLSKSFKEAGEKVVSLKMYLGVNELTSEHPDSRYTISNVDPKADLFDHDNRIAYKALETNGKLFLGKQDVQPGFSVLPLLEVSISEGVWKKTKYIPPTILVKKNNQLGLWLSKVVEEISLKLSMLESKFGASREDELVDTYRLKYTTSNIYGDLAKLTANSKNDAAHPYDMYLILYTILGKLSSFVEASAIELYDHDDIYSVLNAIVNKIVVALQKLVPLCSAIIIDINEKGEFVVDKGYIKPGQPLILGVKRQFFDNKSSFAEWADRLVIASRANLHHFFHTRTHGADRKVIERSPDESVFTTGAIYLMQVELDDTTLAEGDDVLLHDNMAAMGKKLVDSVYLYGTEQEV